jgi:hypothetical protein
MRAFEHNECCMTTEIVEKTNLRCDILKSIALGIHRAWYIKKHLEKQKGERGESKYTSIELNKIYSILSYTNKLKAISSNPITRDNIFDVCNKYAIL